MNKHLNKLPLMWFGLQKRETERYLSHLEWQDNSKAEQLEDLILTEKMINKHLRQELDQKKTQQQHDLSNGFADLLRSRLDHSVEAMRKQGEAERESLLAQLETKKNEQDRTLRRMDKELAEYRSAFNSLLTKASRLITTIHHPSSNPEQTTVTEDVASDPAYPREQLASSAYWRDLQPYMTDGMEDAEEMSVSFPSERQAAMMLSDRVAASAQQELAEAQAAPAQPEMSAMNLAVEEEIRSIQNRYIVGKVAGENLYDEGGNLIIGKGEMITAYTIQAVERAGKLPDLIVQMVFPDIAEPS